MQWKVPEDINKDVDINSLDEEGLNYYHDQMHIFWKKIEEGFYFGWSFKEVYVFHKLIVIEMFRKNISHIHPINQLDNIVFAANQEELLDILNDIKSNFE